MFPCCSGGRDGKKHDDSLVESLPLTRISSGGSSGSDGSASPPSAHSSKHAAAVARWQMPLRLMHALTAISSGWDSAEMAMRAEQEKSERPIDEEITETFVLRNVQNTPAYLHNPHILSGYRVHFSRRLALHSLFRLHNETLNIWTHLLPAIYFTWRLIWTVAAELPALQLDPADSAGPHSQHQSLSATASDFACFAFFYLSACVCFYLSALYHLLGCCSFDAHACLYRCDVSGILALIVGSYVPALHYAFRCRPHLQWGYSAAIGAIVALLLVMFNVPSCNTRRLHSVRVGALVLSVAFAVLPTLHWMLGVLPEDYPALPSGTFLLPLGAMLLCYLGGFGFYSRHVPERWAPGRFDFALQSHNWWHLLVATAAAIWEYELWTMLQHRNMAVC